MLEKLVLILFLFLDFHVFTGVVICLQGSSRAGKSTICEAINKHKNWQAVSGLYFSYCLDEFKQIAPDAFDIISAGIEPENIRHAVTRNMFIFKEQVANCQKTEIKQAAQQIQAYFYGPSSYILHKHKFSEFSLNIICDYLKQKFHVVADTSWYVTPEAIEIAEPGTKVICALVYCPLGMIIERLISQNSKSLASGNIMNYRYFKEVFMSFSALYDLSAKSTYAIDTLNKSEFLVYLDQIKDLLPQKNEKDLTAGFMMQEYTQADLQQYRQIILDKFGQHEQLYLVPKISYDLLLNTNQHTPDACAKLIIAAL